MYLVAGTLSRAVSLILLPLYTRYLDETEVGAFGVLTALVLFLQIMTIAGFDSATGRWYFHLPDEDERRTTFSTWAANQLGTSAVLCALMIVAARPLASGLTGDGARFENAVRLAGVLLLSSTFPNILYNWYRLARRPVAASLTAIGTAATTVAATALLVVVWPLGTAGAMLGQVASGIVMTLVAVRALGSAASPLAASMRRWREMARFALPLIPGGAAFWVIGVADRFLLRALSSVEESGRYHVVATISSGLALVTYAFQQTWGPIALGIKDEARAPRVYRQAHLGYLMLGGVLVVGVAGAGEAVLAILGGATYEGLLATLTVLTASVVLTGSLNVVTIGATIAGTSRPTFEAVTAAAVVNTVGNVLLIPPFGALGAAWATLGSMAVLAAIGLVRSERHFYVGFPRRRSIGVVVAYGIVAGVLTAWSERTGGVTQVVGAAITLVVTAALSALFFRRYQSTGT